MVKSGQAVTKTFTTANPTTGAAADATGTPVGTLYVNGTANAATVTVTNITTGRYKAAVTLPTLSAGDSVDLGITATVAAVAGAGVIWSDNADTVYLSETPAGVWNYLTSAATTAGSMGKRFMDFVTTLVYGADVNVVNWKGSAAPAMTGDAFARLGVPTGASIAADIANVSGAIALGTPHYHHPSSYNKTTGGTVVGLVGVLGAHDASYMEIPEVNAGSGVSGIDIDFTITGIMANHTPTVLSVPGYYTGATAGHSVAIQLWNYQTSAWQTKATMNDRSDPFDYEVSLQEENVSAGEAKVRFLHSAVTGATQHRLYLDMIRLAVVEVTNTDSSTIAAILSIVQDVLEDTSMTLDEKLNAAALTLSSISNSTTNTNTKVSSTGVVLTSAYDKAKDDVLTPLAAAKLSIDAILVDTGTTLDDKIDELGIGMTYVGNTIGGVDNVVNNIHDTDLPAVKTVADAAAADALAAHNKVDALKDFDPANDDVAHVILVDRTIENDDALEWLYVPPAP